MDEDNSRKSGQGKSSGEIVSAGSQPEDFLTSAIKKLPAKKQSELTAAAASEALRIQVKAAESSVDTQIIRDRIDAIVEKAPPPNASIFQSYRGTTQHAGTQVTVKHGCMSVLSIAVVSLSTMACCFLMI